MISKRYLDAKLTPPRSRERTVPRDRLDALLALDRDASLIMISAPAGYGKSTLVAHWFRDLLGGGVWLSADENDTWPSGFLSFFVGGLREKIPEIVAPTSQMLSGNQVSPPAVLSQLAEDLAQLQEPLVIVLDDYHLIESPPLNQAIIQLLEDLPGKLRWVLVSRSEPDLPVARLRATGDVLQLDASDLQFDFDETAAFLAGHGLKLSEADQRQVFEVTEGWAAALNLTSVAIRRHDNIELVHSLSSLNGTGDSDLSQYLWAEVIHGLSVDLREFLTKVSVLDRFTAELAAAVTGSDNASALIASCEDKNLFITSLDPERRWFRFHHLFLEVLADLRDQDLTEKEIECLHRRAALWLENDGSVHQAVQHSIAGKNWDQAERLLVATAKEHFESDRIIDLLAWTSQAPEHLLRKSPQVAFYLGWAQARTGYLKEASETIAICEESLDDQSSPHLFGSVAAWHALAHMIRGEFGAAVEHGSAALQLLDEEHRVERMLAMMSLGMSLGLDGKANLANRHFGELRAELRHEQREWLRLMEVVHGGNALLLQGELVQASELIRQALSDEPERSDYIWVQPALLFLGNIAREQHQLEEARARLNLGLVAAKRTGNRNWTSRLSLGMARLARSTRDFETAIEWTRAATQEASFQDSNVVTLEAAALEAEMKMQLQQWSLASRWADSVQPTLSEEATYRRESEHLAYARFLIYTGSSAAAMSILDRYRLLAQHDGRAGSELRIGILTSLAAREMGEHALALSTLQQTLENGSRLGFVESFLDEWEGLAPLLRSIAARGRNFRHAAFLLSIGESSDHLPYSAGTKSNLSRRELEVLELLATGMSNREIGDHLFISERTVKKHVSNIMGKLGTSNRTRAVSIARNQGIL